MNYLANDLGVDTIELGATLAVLMEAGLGAFGDVKFMADCMAEMRRGTEKGRLWAQGTARVGEHYQVRRVPVIKKQAISAYDPRVVEATGVTMMATAQGADHTAGNLPRLKTREMNLEQIIEQSLAHQARVAANDSLGLCIFGMSVTNPNTEFLANAINAAHGTSLTKDFFEPLGREALRLEDEFNRRAGLHREGRRATGVLLHRAAAAHQPRGALPRRRRATACTSGCPSRRPGPEVDGRSRGDQPTGCSGGVSGRSTVNMLPRPLTPSLSTLIWPP